MSRIVLILFTCLIFLGCKEKLETSVENVNWFFEKNSFEIIERNYGGLGGYTESKIKFKIENDSIQVETKYRIKSPQKRKISKKDFDEVRQIFECVASKHDDEKFPSANSIFPSKIEYILKRRNNEMRLFDFQSKCDDEEVLSKNLNFPNLLDLITEDGLEK